MWQLNIHRSDICYSNTNKHENEWLVILSLHCQGYCFDYLLLFSMLLYQNYFQWFIPIQVYLILWGGTLSEFRVFIYSSKTKMKKFKIIIICQSNVNISKLYTTFMMKVVVYFAYLHRLHVVTLQSVIGWKVKVKGLDS